jgi:soluble lytic murein transglycosylase-like protein
LTAPPTFFALVGSKVRVVIRFVSFCKVTAIFALLGKGFLASASQPSAEVDACLRVAAAKHSVNYILLRAIAEQESNFNPLAGRGQKVAGNSDGSYDYGLMQINSSWLPTLRKFRVELGDLFLPCINADVGAWILANNFRRMGVTWDAVGAYNAKTQWKRVKYATAVYHRAARTVARQDHSTSANSVAESIKAGYVKTVEAEATSSEGRQISGWESQQ